MPKDYYETLGVNKGASQDEIKKAFYKKAHQHHPDKNSGNEQKFKEINEAYQVLGNEEKRKQYDQFGTTFEGAQGFGAGGGFNWQDFAQNGGFNSSGFRTENVNFDFGDLGDIFGDIFGGFGGSPRRRKTRRKAGSDLQMNSTITFLESVFGTEKTVNLRKKIICQNCHGNGAEPGTKIETCSRCGGSGQVRESQRTFFGVFEQIVTCPECNGEGKKPTTVCRQCHGQGVITSEETLKVHIPAGIDDGQTIKLEGKGEAGAKGGTSGDLYININVLPSMEFKREEYNILTKKEISFSQAVLGDKIKIRTVDGEVNLKIPAGTPNNKVFVLSGKGVPRLRGSGRGDHLVEINIKVPKKLTRRQKELIEELKNEETEDS